MLTAKLSLPSAALALLAALAAAPALAQSVAEINGNRFVSPLKGQAVANVTGVVLAKGPNGLWIRSDRPDDSPLTSEALYVFDRNVGAGVSVGDLIAVDGRVLEYRSDAKHLFLTELTAPRNVRVLSSGNAAAPLVVGVDTPQPPTEQYSSLDGGDVFGVPNAAALLTDKNPVLDPTRYGLDFWESLIGQLVTVRAPTSLNRPNNFGDHWVVGDWPATGRNARGGLTMTAADSNPEAILVGSPLDGTSNPKDTKVGDRLADVTGVVTYAFGFYRILPLTAVGVTGRLPYDPRPTTLNSTGDCRGVTVTVFNVENLCATSAHMPRVAAQLVDHLRTPDLVFLQEIQDDSCAANDGTVTANKTLSTLVAAVEALSGVRYTWAAVDPVDNQDGGQPGGNIRPAYLYRPDVLALVDANQGAAAGADKTEVLPGAKGLTFNPGRVEPASAAWQATRKPVAAAWRPLRGGKVFFTVNVHFSSKGGSSSMHGDPRTPENGAVDKRTQQAQVTADFVAQILAQDPKARVIAAGDFNEFVPVAPLQAFMERSGLLDLDAVVGIPPEERYSYVFDMSMQELDHTFVSPALASGNRSQFEHVHVNTWQNTANMVSDHDPSVARFNLCACA
ncbi:hypothetical protein GGTG_13084 [Gaeumannomyces tritici R3-111a-1]|uniref:Endonuclease/exonuclease/phosphatase domain-containing protein n=1 Tax=Gaeumannomyces tritici (strain R3-111a-1) TaxID=644352 RepID=J3PHV3_GAET3|nr:hypothetical protein GGTG_13084 [Gaeumannomyces tritici R3-111a-1]EJT69465.1 hypothetical protein GGTG_13084 [Gaeumannomyces tritici R3-111a-1]